MKYNTILVTEFADGGVEMVVCGTVNVGDAVTVRTRGTP
jgi:hypothetical protein